MKKIAGNQFCLLLFVPDSENRYATFRFTFTKTSVQYDMTIWGVWIGGNNNRTVQQISFKQGSVIIDSKLQYR